MKSKKIITRSYTHPKEPRYAYLDHNHPEIDHKALKVVTYNIKHSKKIDKALKILSSEKDLMGSHIICLQEMSPADVDIIAQKLKFNYVYYPAILHPRSKKDFGNAVLSKFPITYDEKIILPSVLKSRYHRIAVLVKIKIKNISIGVVSVHMKVLERAEHRKEPLTKILRAINAQDCDYAIIAGDFNTFTKINFNSVKEHFKNEEFVHASEEAGWTYKHWYLLNKASKLDHIFSRKFNILRSGKILNKTASDHYPLWVDLSF